jgi:myo-inositol-1(or 4)-monophosphatase
MHQKRIDLARKAAHQTGKTLLDLYQKGDQTGFLKEDHTLVTEADKAADKMIQKMIQDEFPEDQILSEEGSTIYPDSEHVWVIDPLDGTVNFSRGLGIWGVSIAHFVNGMPQTAALYFPVTDELFTAVQGGGALLNGQPLKVLEDSDKDLFPIFFHCSRMHKRYRVNLPYKTRSLGAAAYHLCLIANNKAVLAFESTVRIWDFAASWLVVQEAGGKIESFGEKQPFPALPETDYHGIPFPIIAGSSKKVLAEARNNIVRR